MEEKRTKMDGQRKLTPLETLKAYHDFKQFRKYMYVAIDKMPKWLKHSEGANCIVSASASDPLPVGHFAHVCA